MTAATDTEIQEIKTAIEANTKLIESIPRATEANTKTVTDATQELRLGFAAIDKKIDVGSANVNTKIVRLDGKIDIFGEKFEERTKGFWSRLDGNEPAPSKPSLLVCWGQL